ncbi:MAG: hypothetical protein LW625_04565 [Planctomycetaceae bacterium]|nr:hypothetical protein [Planctomycetaceae bacterium]
MRYEVLIMMVVVGAINVIGRIMAKRAKARLAAEQSNAIESSAEPQPIARRPAVVAVNPTPVPVRETMQAPARVASRSVLRDAVAVEVVPIISTPARVPTPTMAAVAQARVASPTMADVAQARVAKSLAGPARPVRAGWSARRLRDGLVASEILGPPVSLRG